MIIYNDVAITLANRTSSAALMSLQSDVDGGSYIFTGVSGLGKASFAKALIKKCLDVKHLSVSPDFYLIEPEKGVIKLDQIQKVHDFNTLVATNGKRKFCLIDDADQMTPYAQDALLKILEEGTGKTVFILIAKKPLQDTIVSRSRTIGFVPCRKEDLCKVTGADASETAAKLANGRIGFYYRLQTEKKFLNMADDVFRVLRTMEQTSELLFVFGQIKEKDKNSFFEMDHDLVREFLNTLRSIYTDAMVYSMCGNCEDFVEEAKHIASIYSIGCLIECVSSIGSASNAMQTNGKFNKNDFFDLIRGLVRLGE